LQRGLLLQQRFFVRTVVPGSNWAMASASSGFAREYPASRRAYASDTCVATPTGAGQLPRLDDRGAEPGRPADGADRPVVVGVRGRAGDEGVVRPAVVGEVAVVDGVMATAGPATP